MKVIRLLSSVLFFSIFLSANASDVGPKFPTGGGGNDVPIRGGHYDLAHNEEYELVGRVHQAEDGRFLFEIDLAVQPWLATAQRVADPFMEIENPKSLDNWYGKNVRVNVLAHRDVSLNCKDPGSMEMTLHFQSIPMLYDRTPVPLR